MIVCAIGGGSAISRPLLLSVGGIIVAGGLAASGYIYVSNGEKAAPESDDLRRPMQVVIDSSKAVSVSLQESRCILRQGGDGGPILLAEAHPLRRQWTQVVEEYRTGKISSRECGIRLDQIQRDAIDD